MRVWLMVFVLLVSGLMFSTMVNNLDSTKLLNNDNTGAIFEPSEEFAVEGKFSVKVIPSGTSDETKMAFPIEGEILSSWMEADFLELWVFIPEDATTFPEKFFLGMADVTDGWSWMDGVFSESTVEKGWNRVVFKLSPKMKDVRLDGRYMLYFAFIDFEDGKKIPIKDAFYVDSIEIYPAAEEKVFQPIFPMETQEEISRYTNDNTGAVFELSKIFVSQGLRSLKVIPNGEAIETKIALPLEGGNLEKWIGSRRVVMRVYLPRNMKVIPEMYFLGMADVTTEWKWIGGVFANVQVERGWNTITFEIPGPMSDLDPDGKYMVYLAFAGFDSNKQKIPLVDPFYVDGISAEKTRTQVATLEDLLASADPAIKEEVQKMLNLNDEELLDYIQHKTFLYFWNEVNPESGLVRDRSREDAPCSIAAVGFALTAIPVAIERGWISYNEGYERTLTTLKTFVEGEVEGKNGFFYHFVDMKTGKRVLNSEISSIDTAILVAGALFAGAYFKGTEVEQLADQLYRNVNWEWMLAEDGTLYMGWKPEGGFLNAKWDSFNEGILAYVLAIGSPTHPIPASSWDKIFRPIHENYISCPTESLFVYQYPQVWLDLRDKEDKYANYYNNAIFATRYNYLFCVMNRFKYKTYDLDIWGLSACDGPAGYKHYGASEGNHDGTVAPYASVASIVFTPDLALKGIKGMLKKYGPLVWGKYGFVSGFNVDQNWFSREFVGIDEGNIIAMIENYRSELIWKNFMSISYIKNALEKIGFINKKSEYAVTPAYMEEYKKLLTQPEGKVAIAPRKEVIVIDGKLDDWEGVPVYEVNEDMNVPAAGLKPVNKRTQILHSQFRAAWDDKYLYLAARVYDEYLVINITPQDLGAFYRTDSIEFYIDPSRAGSNTGIFKLAVLPFDTEGNPQAVRHEDANPGPISKVAPDVKVASTKTEDGYIIEVAIPFKYLGIAPREGIEIGFCHTVHNSNRRDAKLGEYVRENMISWVPVADVWARPETWGTLKFVEKAEE
ncbi:MAG: hypothetical protein XD57_0778 [Thermotoga petrophila]|uniref:Glycoamylase-like domain-containing protein n=1 Tax=Thermotoga petrophila TaxID=93929 RepID=A0A101EQW9_9THEM|nr:MAG: hypothetical protein XD57_0778 [Thermotoga petrophila]